MDIGNYVQYNKNVKGIFWGMVIEKSKKVKVKMNENGQMVTINSDKEDEYYIMTAGEIESGALPDGKYGISLESCSNSVKSLFFRRIDNPSNNIKNIIFSVKEGYIENITDVTEKTEEYEELDKYVRIIAVPEERKDVDVRFRCSTEQKMMIAEAAKNLNMTMTDYIINNLVCEPIHVNSVNVDGFWCHIEIVKNINRLELQARFMKDGKEIHKVNMGQSLKKIIEMSDRENAVTAIRKIIENANKSAHSPFVK